MRTVVTGGSGVVGAALVRHLVERGDPVEVVCRSEKAAQAVEGLGAIPVAGDIEDAASLRDAFRGAELIYHVAGLNTMCPDDPIAMERINVVGSQNVIRAAAASGCRRVVYTSSAATIGEARGTVGNEDTPHRGWYLSAYERSKHLAEQAVLAMQADVEIVSVNPSSVQGPGRSTGTGGLILDVLRGRLPVLVDTRMSIVDIDDCARGHLAAAERGVPGERYLLNSFTIGMREAVELLETVTGQSLAVRWVPGWTASAGAALIEAVSRIAGRSPHVCREMVRTLRHGHAYDGSRAAVELGVTYTSADVLLSRLVGWFRSEGLL
ncbi:MAG: NAD-dependent epimerase/dehydratase family protein [Acidimicrobiia bacterium]|nr:NAD-dependent epimerase/dehydratase family protein [Acidimicrobiia bacterium]